MGRTAPPKTYFDRLKQLFAKLCTVLVMVRVKMVRQGKGDPDTKKINTSISGGVYIPLPRLYTKG